MYHVDLEDSHLLQADVALEAMSPSMQKLLKTRRQKAKWAGGIRKVRRKIHKTATLAHMEEPAPSEMRHQGAVAKRKLMCESPDLRRGQQCPSPYEMCRSPTPSRAPEHMARGRDEDVQIVGYLHLPLLSNVGEMRKGKNAEKEQLVTKMTISLPPIHGATPGNEAAIALDITRKSRRHLHFSSDVDNWSGGEGTGVSPQSYHPFKKVRALLRSELITLKTKAEVEEECRMARLILRSDSTFAGQDGDGKIAKLMHKEFLNYLPNATDNVRLTSLLALLDAEEQHRMSLFKGGERGHEMSPKLRTESNKLQVSFEPTSPTAEKPHKQAPRQLQRAKSTLSNKPQQATTNKKAGPGKSADAPAPQGKNAGLLPERSKTVKLDVASSSSPRNEKSTASSEKSFFVRRMSKEKKDEPTLADITKESKANNDAKATGSEFGAVPRQHVEACFKKFQDDGSVHHDDIMSALENLGFLARDDWVDEVYSQITKFAVIKWDQFEKFIKNYSYRQVEAFREAFHEFDEDMSGRIDMAELANLLHKFEIEPMAYVLQEVIREVDPMNFGVLDLKKFTDVMEIITGREGFSRSEHRSLMDAFRKFDVDHSGEISKQEFTSLLLYLGLGTSPDTIAMLLAQFEDDSGPDKEYHMGEREFLHCVKKARDEDLNKVKLAIEENDADGSGTLSEDELQDVFEALGYYPSQAAVLDACEEVGLDLAAELDPSQFWQLLQALRSREGFCNAETSDAQETFKRYSSLDFISGPDLDIALRYMGYVVTFDRQQSLVYQVDLDMSGQLDYYEFRKLLRICRDRDITELKRLVRSDRTKTSAGLMRQSNAGSILTVMGFHDSEGEVPLITDEDIHPKRRGHEFCVNVFDLVQVMIKLSWNKRKFAREHCGFCMKEVAEYKQIFRTADSEDTGELHSGQVVRLLELLFPEMSGDPIVRQQLSQIVKDADMNGNSHLDLKDFLHLMRTCANLQIKARHDKERHAIQETAFSPAEISDFRHIFLAADVDNSQELSLQEFRKMMASICPMGAKNSDLLSTIFFRITNRQCQVEGSHDHADFAEFMWLWHHLLETNFGGIRETTEKAKELKAKKEQHALANMGRRRSSVRVVIAKGS